MPRTAILAAALAASTLTALPGCLVTSNSSSSYSGNRVEPGDERQVLLRQTTTDEAVDNLGEPTTRWTNDRGEEVLTWTWTKRSQSSGSVFLIFGGSSDTTHEHSLNIAFRDGVAARKWRD